MESVPLHRCSSADQFEALREAGREFRLLLTLPLATAGILWRLYALCLGESRCRGVVFVVDRDRILFSRLFFLREIMLKLKASGRSVGVWGVPECVLLEILGPWDYTLLRPEMTDPEGPGRCAVSRVGLHGSALMRHCAGCILCKTCEGMGSRQENLVVREFRTVSRLRRKGRDRFFESGNPQMRRRYRAFCDYVDQSDLRYADRYLYFIRNLDFGSPFSQKERFVYHCDYLPPAGYVREGDFLATQSRQKALVERIVRLGETGRVSRLGYSAAVRESEWRESFYLAPGNGKDLSLLDALGPIPHTDPVGELFGGVGMDFYNGTLHTFKVYHLVRREWVMRFAAPLAEATGIDLAALREPLHYYVERLDPSGRRLSHRIDLTYRSEDHPQYEALIDRFGFDAETLTSIRIFGFAFDFEGESLTKINLYFRNVYG